MPIRDLNQGLKKEHYLEDPDHLLRREFGEPLPSHSHGSTGGRAQSKLYFHKSIQVYTWKNRELEWYNAERRFIFACKSDDERT